jgi:signal transduction histidine kinase
MRRSLPRHAHIGLAAVAAAFGILSLAAARHDPAGSFAGTSTLGGVAELAAGWSLVLAGLLFSVRHPANRTGVLLTAAGSAWFLPEWSNPGVGTAVGFTVGIVGISACVPLVAHAAAAYPTGRLRSRVDVTVVSASYAGALLLLGLLPAMAFDPEAAGCVECPRNLVLIHGDADLYDKLNHYGLRVGIGWLAALAALLVWRLIRSFQAVVLPALVPATLYLGFVAWDFQHSLSRGILSNDSFDRTMWRYEAAALAAFALAVVWALARERQARSAVARLVVELGRLPTQGSLREALAQTLGDPTLELAYQRSETGRYVDAFGRPVEIAERRGRAVTPLVRGDTPVGALVHDIRLLDRPGLLQEVLAAARLAVENERLEAEVRAQLEELRASRTRIVEAGDAERRRLERDLHDGAQQQLLSLSYDLRLARTAAESNAATEVLKLVAAAGEEVQAAVGELRDLAHGIYPAVLAEGGLAPALDTLADEAPLPVELGDVSLERYSAPVETAAYLTVAEAVGDAAEREATFVSVDANREGERLIVATKDDGSDRVSTLVHLADRIGALGGSLDVGQRTLRATIPCA